MRWQLASNWRLLQMACQSDVSWGVPIHMNHCARTRDRSESCPLSLSRSVVTSYEVRLAIWRPALPVSLQSSSFAEFWRAECNRCWCEASCHLPATDTWIWVILLRDKVILPQLGRCLNINDDFGEVGCVPSAARVPLIHRSQKKNDLGFRVFLLHFFKFLWIFLKIWLIACNIRADF